MVTDTLSSPSLSASEDAIHDATAMQGLVDALTRRLDEAGIPWCLLRNRDRIPDGLLAWSDLDMMVPETVSRERLIRLLADFDPVTIAPRRAGETTFFFPIERHVLRIDLFHGDIEWRAAVYGENQGIIPQRLNDRGMMVASVMDQALMAWFEKLVRKRTFISRYEPIITEAYLSQPGEFRRRLEKIVGRTLAEQLIALVESGALPECVSLAPACRHALWLGALRRHPLRTMGRFVRQIGDAIEHRVHPSGLDVAILGPDGVGKSTLCATIANLPVQRIPFGDATYRRLYHRLLPTLGQIQTYALRHETKFKRDPNKPQSMPPLHPLVWLCVYGYYAVDLWLSALLWNRRKLAHITMVLHDRHPIEVVIDPLRYRYEGPGFVPRMLAWFLPKPDLFIVLDAPAEIIQSRKHELTLEEIHRQRIAYRDLALSSPRGQIVDANQPFEKVLEDVLRTVMSFTRERTHQRYPRLLEQEAHQ